MPLGLGPAQSKIRRDLEEEGETHRLGKACSKGKEVFMAGAKRDKRIAPGYIALSLGDFSQTQLPSALGWCSGSCVLRRASSLVCISGGWPLCPGRSRILSCSHLLPVKSVAMGEALWSSQLECPQEKVD
jgi:hypothetical protein